MSETTARVAILMGSDSDWPVMKGARDVLKEFGVPFDVRVLSAHRTPRSTTDYASTAITRGLRVLIAGAGGAAHLAGVLAANTTVPVIGVPVANGPLNGFDSLLATVQMPRGVPVATVGINRADNAALLAVQILASGDASLHQQLVDFRRALEEKVEMADKNLQGQI